MPLLLLHHGRSSPLTISEEQINRYFFPWRWSCSQFARACVYYLCRALTQHLSSFARRCASAIALTREKRRSVFDAPFGTKNEKVNHSEKPHSEHTNSEVSTIWLILRCLNAASRLSSPPKRREEVAKFRGIFFKARSFLPLPRRNKPPGSP